MELSEQLAQMVARGPRSGGTSDEVRGRVEELVRSGVVVKREYDLAPVNVFGDYQAYEPLPIAARDQ